MRESTSNRPWHFKKGNKLGVGGKREGAGRPTQAAIFQLEVERQAFIRAAFENGEEMGRHYRAQALQDNTVLKDYRQAIIGKDDEQASKPTVFAFIQFNPANNSIQLPSAPIPGAILVEDAGEAERVPSVASEKRQGQDRVKFHSFADVGRKRR